MAILPFQLVAPEPLLRAERVTIEYPAATGTVRATHEVSFDVHCGDRFVLLGPSGCGKSTLLKAVAGFITPRAGSLRLHGAPILRPGPDRIVVFQEFDQLPPWKTVKRNVMFPLLCGGMREEAAEARARHWLDKVGLSKFADSYPHTLS
ncbi:MAG TPA: ATP-binding cassette domain-containing protein, partial [Telluria sp.]